MQDFLQKLKSYMMPISMTIGAIFYPWLQHLSVITTFLIFAMLFITFCNVSIKDIKITKLHIWLILIQLTGCIAIYLSINWYNPILAQGAMICMLAPTATSSVVICGMLGGNTASLTTYSLLCNIVVALFAPILFAFLHNEGEISFVQAAFAILQKIGFILLTPLLIAYLIQRFAPTAHSIIRKSQVLSFYLWNIALITVTAKTVQFIVNQGNSHYRLEILLAIVAGVTCVAQFVIGRRLGRKFNDTVAGGQGLGQKNTILAIWMAQTYFNPISSIAPGAYVLWQNMINSYQVWRIRKKGV